MKRAFADLSASARRAAQRNDWQTVSRCAADLVAEDSRSPEGHFLAGLVEQAAGRSARAAECFARALGLDESRYDAAIELATRYGMMGHHSQAFELLQRYEPLLGNSPRYLDMAGLAYSTIGLHQRAWPLYRRANEMQPGVPRFMAHLAACAVTLGRFGEAKAVYRALLDREPAHQRNHYQLAQLERASDSSHIEQMKSVLRATQLPPARNIYLYYAIGKELEDIGRWDEAFEYYRMAGNAVTSIARYDVSADIELIDAVIANCTPAWLAEGAPVASVTADGRTPIFIVGLPRTGTTLTERIIASHSQVDSIGETMRLPVALRRISGVETPDTLNPAIIAAASTRELGLMVEDYMHSIRHRLGDRPMFIEKYPENFQLLGFIAKAWPAAKLVYLRRNPMDSCFAMYKQSYFRFAYTLENLGRYFVAHDRLLRHWRSALGARLVEVSYESLVADQVGETRRLLEKLGLTLEPACLAFEANTAPSATASAVQIREGIHSRSVDRWRHFERHLQPLRRILEDAGITIE